MKKSFLYISLLVFLSSCVKEVLDKRDLTGVGTEAWDVESTADLYLNRSYSVIMPNWPANAGQTLPFALHNTTDDYSTTGNTAILFGTLGIDAINDFAPSATSNTGTWYNVRRLNILLQGVNAGKLPEAVKTRIKAEAYFLRAYIYFNLVKLYGGVPIVTKPQDWENDELLVPRNKTSECIDFICKDLDSAALAPAALQANYSASSGNRGRITQAAALAFKGRVLLYWASAQFNPNNDPARWKRAYDANKIAFDVLTTQGYALYPAFSAVLTDESSANKEVIILRSYDGSTVSGNFNSYEAQARPSSEGGGTGYNPTWNLVRAFPMKNGKAITETGSGYDSVYYWRNRDPRLDATVVYNGATWALSGVATRRQWMFAGTTSETTISPTGFYARKGVNPATLRTNAAYGGTDWIEMRFAEVMLNLAECANATGLTNDAYTMMTAIRKRAGIDAGTDNLYGLKPGMTQAEMLTAIINERRIEFAFEGKRYDDLRRTKLWTTLNGTYRQKLVFAIKAPYVATTNTATANNLNGFVPGTSTYLRDTINLNTDSYAKIFTVTVANLESTPINFKPEYYFYAIPTSNITRDPNMKQTNGWGTGGFDPLQ
ncbi:MAG: RagB/SusD family nutrient uptake outer membrane protein [Williamsia sp.]|nr:RagB/SusD family nutrient uptake outer membrane protein [Williamsia sp.]